MKQKTKKETNDIDQEIKRLQQEKIKQNKIEELQKQTKEIEQIQSQQLKRKQIIEEQHKQKAKEKQTQNNINLIQTNLSWWNLSDYKTRYFKRFKKYQIIICNFELNNGHHTTSLLPIVKGKVTFNGNTYVIDDSLKYYHLGFSEWCLDYHEGFSLPIKRKIPLNEINDSLIASKIGNIAYATNPTTLKTFQVNEVVRSAIQSAGITDFFRQVRLLVIIGALSSLITLILFAYTQGLFSKMGNII